MRSDYRLGFKSPRRLYSQTVTTNTLRLLWALLIIWGELGAYFWSLSSCRWPMPKTSGEALHVLLISDTQIHRPQSSSLFPHVQGFIVDQFLKKSWHVTSRLKPNVIFFLGDMLANGKSARSEAQYAGLVQKFKTIFPLEASTLVYYLPGNNDIGMGVLASSSARTYYQKSFGPLNELITLKNHTFLALDAPSLIDEDYQRNARGVPFDQWEPIPGGAVEAVQRTAAQQYHPLILLSHIPLYRPDTASCGPLREKGTITRGVGHGYQNALGKQTTAFLMKALQPVGIFSGDNRDYCEYVHQGTSFGVVGSIPEITVKSFSPAPRIRRPGFQLLSIIDPANIASSQQSFLHRPCLLPDQKSILTAYAWWFISTLCVLLILNVQRVRRFRLINSVGFSLTSSAPNSNHTSPLLQDTDEQLPIWSPHTPFMPTGNTRPPMPSTFRTPVAPATPTFRASSRPMTPQGFDSPMLTPQFIPPLEDEEDSMFPDRYTTQREIRHPSDEEWSPIGRDENLDSGLSTQTTDESRRFPVPSQFISAPGGAPTHHRRQSSLSQPWSWTFVLRGRRRRITLRVPKLATCWSSCKDIFEILRDADRRTLLRRRRGIIGSTLIESGSVFLPAAVIWLIINYWVF